MRLASLVFLSLLSVSEAFWLIIPVPKNFATIPLSLVRENLIQSANTSWEKGTTAEALTELSWPSLSVFSDNPFPLPTYLNQSLNASDVLAIATETVQTNSTSLSLVNDSSAGDPASIGVAVLLANWTRTDPNNTIYSTAASNELEYLLTVVPRTADGAISHRTDEVQLWADFVYMAPPFIAYYGALQDNSTLLQIAFDQCRLYRNYLRDAETGLWRHVVLGSWQDNTLWGTGNGWAAAGMLRVLETIRHSSNSWNFTEQQGNLTTWIQEIVNGTWQYQTSNGTLLNALNDPTSFADSSSTALLGSATYRLAVLTNDSVTHINSSEQAYQLVQQSVDIRGWLRNTVDPFTFNTPSGPDSVSPEGQAFVLLLESARRDYMAWVAQNVTSPSNATTPLLPTATSTTTVPLVTPTGTPQQPMCTLVSQPMKRIGELKRSSPISTSATGTFRTFILAMYDVIT